MDSVVVLAYNLTRNPWLSLLTARFNGIRMHIAPSKEANDLVFSVTTRGPVPDLSQTLQLTNNVLEHRGCGRLIGAGFYKKKTQDNLSRSAMHFV